ncbi:MAG: hypothetical protein ABI076_11110, partial [Acidobacteriaceae bacterium]
SESGNGQRVYREGAWKEISERRRGRDEAAMDEREEREAGVAFGHENVPPAGPKVDGRNGDPTGGSCCCWGLQPAF